MTNDLGVGQHGNICNCHKANTGDGIVSKFNDAGVTWFRLAITSNAVMTGQPALLAKARNARKLYCHQHENPLQIVTATYLPQLL
jgi:hypothetical protein